MQLHQEVVLSSDISKHGLRRGDMGTIVHVYPSGGLEVEFFTATGKRRAVIALRDTDVRSAADNEIVAVRALEATG